MRDIIEAFGRAVATAAACIAAAFMLAVFSAVCILLAIGAPPAIIAAGGLRAVKREYAQREAAQ